MQWGPGCTFVLEIWCRDLSWIQRDLYISLGDVLEAELDKQTAFLDAEEMHLSWVTLPGPSKLSIEALTIQCWVQGMSNRQSVQNVGAAHKAFSLLPSVHHIWMRNLPSKLGSEAQLSLPLRLLSNSTHFYLHSSLEMQSFQKHKANRSDSSNVLLPPPNNTKHDILKQNWVSVRSKITGCRLLLIPCKQTGDFVQGFWACSCTFLDRTTVLRLLLYSALEDIFAFKTKFISSISRFCISLCGCSKASSPLGVLDQAKSKRTGRAVRR